jgi:hypothetical protein
MACRSRFSLTSIFGSFRARQGGDAIRTHGLTIVAIKAVHTLIFFAVFGAIVDILRSGLEGKPTRRTGIASGIALTESAIFVANRGRCPLTGLAESLGDPHAAVSDIYLPRVLARTLPYWSGPLLAFGLALNLISLRSRRGRGGPIAL